MIIKCDYCGTYNRDTLTNCKNCGQPVRLNTEYLKILEEQNERLENAQTVLKQEEILLDKQEKKSQRTLKRIGKFFLILFCLPFTIIFSVFFLIDTVDFLDGEMMLSEYIPIAFKYAFFLFIIFLTYCFLKLAWKYRDKVADFIVVILNKVYEFTHRE